MNDLGYGQLSNPNRSLKLILMHVESIRNSFSDISNTLAKDFITSHSLSQSPQIPRVDDLILITQSYVIVKIIVDFMSYPIYDILDISWLGIRKS